MEPIGENLDDVLKKLLAAIPEIKAAAITSLEGLPIASALPLNMDETRVAVMNAVLLAITKYLIFEMKEGEFHQISIKGRDGYYIVLPCGANAIIAFSTTKDIRLDFFNNLSFSGRWGGDRPHPLEI
ncbi:MAG: roadblock/LC7 domain-containing protein [Promethearchaeota archaeon]